MYIHIQNALGSGAFPMSLHGTEQYMQTSLQVSLTFPKQRSFITQAETSVLQNDSSMDFCLTSRLQLGFKKHVLMIHA